MAILPVGGLDVWEVRGYKYDVKRIGTRCFTFRLFRPGKGKKKETTPNSRFISLRFAIRNIWYRDWKGQSL